MHSKIVDLAQKVADWVSGVLARQWVDVAQAIAVQGSGVFTTQNVYVCAGHSGLGLRGVH